MSSSPFLFIADARYRSLKWALITAPITARSHHRDFAELARLGYRFAGMPGYLTFPRADSSDIRDYASLCEFWCHGFREPDRYLPRGKPRALISHSDFSDPRQISPDRLKPQASYDFAHDFMYVGSTEPWKRRAKNWSLASRCIPRICRELNLRALVIGAPTEDFPATPQIRFSGWLEWDEFLVHLAASRFLLAPNRLDPSPKVLAEALCLNVPVVVNRRILGGWKYVNAFTGTFFEDESDVVAAVESCLRQPGSPRRWFSANYGPYLSGKRLRRLLLSVDPHLPESSHVVITPSPLPPADPRL